MRGDVHRLRASRDARGHEQQGRRFCVIVQSDDLPLSTLVVAPTSTAARPATFRPEIRVEGMMTRVLVEQAAAVDPSRLGDRVGHVTLPERQRIDAALRIVLAL